MIDEKDDLIKTTTDTDGSTGETKKDKDKLSESKQSDDNENTQKDSQGKIDVDQKSTSSTPSETTSSQGSKSKIDGTSVDGTSVDGTSVDGTSIDGTSDDASEQSRSSQSETTADSSSQGTVGVYDANTGTVSQEAETFSDAGSADSVFDNSSSSESIFGETGVSENINDSDEVEQIILGTDEEKETSIDKQFDSTTTDEVISDGSVAIEETQEEEEIINIAPTIASISIITQEDSGDASLTDSSTDGEISTFLNEGILGADFGTDSTTGFLAQYSFSDPEGDAIVFEFADSVSVEIQDLLEIVEIDSSTFGIRLKDDQILDRDSDDLLNDDGAFSVSFKASDGTNIVSDIPILKVNVVNVAPVSILDTIETSVDIDEGSVSAGAVIKEMEFDDPGTGDGALSYSFTTVPEELAEKLVIVRDENTGKATLKVGSMDSDGNYSETDGEGNPIILDRESLTDVDITNGQADITITVTDPHGGEIQHSFVLTVNDIAPGFDNNFDVTDSTHITGDSGTFTYIVEL